MPTTSKHPETIVLHGGNYRKDETTKLPYQKDLILVTGNAGGIIIKIGNNIINKIGESGEVKRNISLNLENLIKFIEE